MADINGAFKAKVDISAEPDKLAAKDYQWAEESGFTVLPIVIGGKLEVAFAPGKQSMLFARLMATSVQGGVSTREHKNLDEQKRVQKFFEYVPAAKVLYEIIGPAGEAIRKAFQPRVTVDITPLQPFTKTDSDVLSTVGLPLKDTSGKMLAFAPGRGLMFFDERGGFFERKEKIAIGYPLVPFDPSKVLPFRLDPGKPIPTGVYYLTPKSDSDVARTGTGVDSPKDGGPPPVPTGKPGIKPIASDPAKAAKAAGEAAGKALAAAGKPKKKPASVGPLVFIVGGLAAAGLLLLGRKR